MAFAAIAAGVIGLGAGIGGALIQKNATDSAIQAQQNAINSLGSFNIPKLESMASTQDLAKYQADFKAQVENDPAYAQLRSAGADSLNNLITADNSGNSVADKTVNKASAALDANSPATASLISGLMDQASKELASGATLPPEFQAELIRSGLQSNGTNGVSIDGRGAGGTNIRTLLGSAGLQLQSQRQQQAEALGTTATNIQTQQQSALDELAQMSNQLSQSKMSRAGSAIASGNAALPSIGLSGQDAVNLDTANTNMKNQSKLAYGNLNAQGSLANGAMWSGILGSIGSGAGSILGGLNMNTSSAPSGTFSTSGAAYAPGTPQALGGFSWH